MILLSSCQPPRLTTRSGLERLKPVLSLRISQLLPMDNLARGPREEASPQSGCTIPEEGQLGSSAPRSCRQKHVSPATQCCPALSVAHWPSLSLALFSPYDLFSRPRILAALQRTSPRFDAVSTFDISVATGTP